MITHSIMGLWMGLSALIIPPSGQTYAVVIGISDYQALSYKTGDLRYAARDAEQVTKFLQSRAGGSVPLSHIRLLTNSQATQLNISRALVLFRQAAHNDRVILYFSGHGMRDSFVPYDGTVVGPSKMLTHRAVKAAFLASNAITKLCIADACLSGSMTRQTKQKSSAQAFVGTVDKNHNVAMLLASRSTQYAIESRRLAGGAFTHFMLEGLAGKADTNRDKIVTIKELHRYISPLIRQTTRGKQAPVFYGHFSDTLALSYL